MTSAIKVHNLSKAYRLGERQETPDTLVGAAANWLKSPYRNWRNLRRLDVRAGADSPDVLWALKDVSFSVAEGEVIGIIGRNGAGKSTLLKILSRITEPTSGRAVVRGRVSSLLEVGTGFHPDLTGRENIYMNGTILGMTRREIDRKFDEIVDFSGVEKSLDTPIKHYSSGMTVRLAFAVAAHLEPEILIIDEVLAVGDADFQKKCLGKMKDVATGGKTVFFVSHNMAAVRNLTTACILLQNGAIACQGRTEDVIREYTNLSLTLRCLMDGELGPFRNSDCDPRASVKFKRICLESGSGIAAKCEEDNDGALPMVEWGQDFRIAFELEASEATTGLQVVASLVRDGEQRATTIVSSDTLNTDFILPAGRHTLECSVPRSSFSPGRYSLDAKLILNVGTHALDIVIDYPLFDAVLPKDSYGTALWSNRPWGAVHLGKLPWSCREGVAAKRPAKSPTTACDVSIVIPCYNGSRYLREAIESALAQTVIPVDVIVVDDGSTDDSAAIAESFGSAVHVIRQPNQGESVARNRGVRAAHGSHILFLDADDHLHPEALGHLVKVIQGDQDVALMGCASYIDDPLRPQSVVTPNVTSFLPEIATRNLGVPLCWLTPKRLIEQVGGFCAELRYSEDWDFWCQIALTGANLRTTDFVGAYYRRHPLAQSATAKAVDRKRGHVAVVERLVSGLLMHPKLVEEHGRAVFWSGWSAVASAREMGISWRDLAPLSRSMRRLAGEGPSSLRDSKFGRVVRILGMRTAFLVQSLRSKSESERLDDRSVPDNRGKASIPEMLAK